MNEDLKKAAKRGRGKREQEHKVQWIDAFTDVVRTDPCGTVLVIGADHKPHPKKRTYTKKIGWAFEFFKTGDWEYSTVLNLDKMNGAIRFTHSLTWCMEKLHRERDMFLKGDPPTWDKCNFRLHNLVDDNVLMVAILVK